MSEKHHDKEREGNQTTREVLRESSSRRDNTDNSGVTPLDEASQTTGTGRTREDKSGVTTKNTVTGSDFDGQAV